MAIKGTLMTMNAYCRQQIDKDWYGASSELGNIYFRWRKDSEVLYLCAETGGTFRIGGEEEDEGGMSLSEEVWVIGTTLSEVYLGGE